LGRRRHRDEIGAILEPTNHDDSVQDLGRQVRDDLRHVRRVNQPFERVTLVARWL
jgi:hypothetical protein